MENTEDWNVFTRTGSVSDYLKYVNSGSLDRNRADAWINRREERGLRERTSEGDGAFIGYHW